MQKLRFYEVAVLSAGASNKSVFTYQHDLALRKGSLVRVPLNTRTSYGVVMGAVGVPHFKTRAILASANLPALPPQLMKLALWMSKYYAVPLAQIWQTFLPGQPFLTRKSNYKLPPPPKPTKVAAVKLSADQRQAIRRITRSSAQDWLLWGATGSGKTQVYIELAGHALKRGLSTIILVPEISLTPQVSEQLRAHFGGQVYLTHSALSPAARRAVWQQVLATSSPVVVVGPRSALFMPVKKLGFIIIDEAHDGSYKQDQSPRYHAGSTARALAGLHQAKLILGSATPSLNSMYAAENKALELVKMARPIFKADRQPPVIIDLKNPSNLRRSSLLSETLIKTLGATLSNGKQSLLFLNRRGHARLGLCRQCGWVALCPNCQIPLILHADEGQLRCHWCGFKQSPPAACPKCSNLDIKFLGSGTKRLEAELSKLFPTARLSRLDRDSFDAGGIERLYQELRRGKVDILVGTQMITKGLDLPGVETVGIILADNMLYVPDFSASERTFQALYQVSGRAGRREGGIANLIIQTYSPNHPAIEAAAQRDYMAFYAVEAQQRRAMAYPPFTHLLKLWVARPTRSSAQASATKLASRLKAVYPTVEIIGPAPAWRETFGGKYTWQIIAKARARRLLVSMASDLPAGWSHDLDPIDLL